MSGLFHLLHIGSGALQAQQSGVAVAGNNAANVNTVGYSRQEANLSSNLRAPLVGGVRFGDPTRAQEQLLEGRRRVNAGGIGLSEAFTEALMEAEQALTTPGTDITSPMAVFFGALNEVSSAPNDELVRDSAVTAARELALAIRQSAQEIASARERANDQIGDVADSAVDLARQIAELNQAIASEDDPVLHDKRDLAALQLSELVGGQARIDSDGHMRFTLPNGAALVDGTEASTIEVTPDATNNNFYRIEVVNGNHRRDITSSLDGGRLAGLQQFRDTEGATLATELDQLAFDLATQVNAVHRANDGLDGVSGRDLFVEPAAVAGSAAAFDISTALAADSSVLAASGPGAGVGDNQGALALIALRDQDLAGGNTRTFGDEAIRFITDLGRQANSADLDREYFGAQKDSLDGLRDSLAGVNMQEELANLSQYRYAAEAATNFISTVDGLLGTIINNL